MDREFLTDEDIHALDEDDEMTVLRNKLSRANERIEELEDKINTAIGFIQKDLIVNRKWQEEEKSPLIIRLTETLIKFDNCLLEALKSDE